MTKILKSNDSLTKEYKKNPTLENYVKLRRAHPDEKIEVAVLNGLDQLVFMEPELKCFGIDPELMASVLDADYDAISTISLQLTEALLDRRTKRKEGETQLVRRRKVVPDKLIDWIVVCALEAMSWNNALEIPMDLLVLIRERLVGENQEYGKAFIKSCNRQSASIVAAQLLHQGKPVTIRSVSRLLGVSPSTVMRWFANDSLVSNAERNYKTLYESKRVSRE